MDVIKAALDAAAKNHGRLSKSELLSILDEHIDDPRDERQPPFVEKSFEAKWHRVDAIAATTSSSSSFFTLSQHRPFGPLHRVRVFGSSTSQ